MFARTIKTSAVTIFCCIFLIACQTVSVDTKKPNTKKEDDTQQQQATDYIVLNQYDDPWENHWISHLKNIYRKTSLACGNIEKTPGFVVHLGDSITYAHHYGTVSRQGVSQFSAIVDWSKSLGGRAAAADNKNGWQLASFDHPSGGRSYTAVSGITAHQYLYGGQGDFAGGFCDDQPLTTLLNNRTSQPSLLCPEQDKPPKVGVIRDSVIAIVLLGSNDIYQGKFPIDIYRDLKTVVQQLKQAHIMPVLSTIPPRRELEFEVITTNQKIIRLAQEEKLPIIGFWEEIIKRRPDLDWHGTLISADGVHPTAGEYSDPSLDPDILNRSGYTLRGYLTLLKIKEIKNKVIDIIEPC